MQIILEQTTKMVELNGVPARIWEGKTAGGIPVHAYITRLAVDIDEDQQEFERELEICRPPSQELRAIPLRQIL